MVELEEMGERGFLLLALLRMEGLGEKFNATQFQKAVGIVPEAAKRLRNDFIAWGLLEAREVGRQGRTVILEIRRTPAYFKLLPIARQMQEALRAIPRPDRVGPSGGDGEA